MGFSIINQPFWGIPIYIQNSIPERWNFGWKNRWIFGHSPNPGWSWEWRVADELIHWKPASAGSIVGIMLHTPTIYPKWPCFCHVWWVLWNISRRFFQKSWGNSMKFYHPKWRTQGNFRGKAKKHQTAQAASVTFLVGGLEHSDYFPRNIGKISSSQLTKSYFSGWGGWPKHQAAITSIQFLCPVTPPHGISLWCHKVPWQCHVAPGLDRCPWEGARQGMDVAAMERFMLWCVLRHRVSKMVGLEGTIPLKSPLKWMITRATIIPCMFFLFQMLGETSYFALNQAANGLDLPHETLDNNVSRISHFEVTCESKETTYPVERDAEI